MHSLSARARELRTVMCRVMGRRRLFGVADILHKASVWQDAGREWGGFCPERALHAALLLGASAGFAGAGRMSSRLRGEVIMEADAPGLIVASVLGFAVLAALAVLGELLRRDMERRSIARHERTNRALQRADKRLRIEPVLEKRRKERNGGGS